MNENRPDVDIDVLELLDLWWRYESKWLPVQGFPAECPSTRGWICSRQWDNINGSFDSEATAQLAQRIGHVVATMDQPWRTVLHVVARNRASTVSVWSSPVMPSDPVDRAYLVSQSLEKFRGLL